MRRFLTIPHEPLARFRLLAAAFAAAIAFLNVGMLALSPGLGLPLRWETATAAALLGAWWLYGYRRGGFATAGWLVDIVLVPLVAFASPMPLRAVGLFYAGIQLRAVYVTRREFPLLVLSYGVARLASFVIIPTGLAFGALSATSAAQVLGLTIIALTLHLLVAATKRHADIERALEHSDERYRLVAGAMRDVVYDWDVATSRIEWTESLYSAFGFTRGTIGADIDWWLARVHPLDRAALERTVAGVIADPQIAMETVQFRARRADDSYAYVSGSMIVQRSAQGTAERVIGSIRDITTEQQLEERLRESQKMQAIGQLAGGVAHDFNNLLTVIGGHVFMLEHQPPDKAVADKAVAEKHLGGITRAADRAATLTRQLLAFGSKQILAPSLLDVNGVVRDVLQMLRPLIGANIRIVTHLDPGLSTVFADAGQLGQVFVNLALNARDAMPNGGTLVIETGNAVLEPRPDDAGARPLAPGEYVRVMVQDSGAGMDAETLSRVFEPFFTTKAPGAGAGLGLATVYGIVKQSAGDIQAVSAPGGGSSFTIHLPVAHSEVLTARTSARSNALALANAARSEV